MVSQKTQSVCSTRQKLAVVRPPANPKRPRGATGPTTPEGKSRVAVNPIRHGGYAAASEALPILGECPEDFAALIVDLVEALRPVGPLEMRLVDRIAGLWWRMERAARAEREGLKATLEDAQYLNGETRLLFPRSRAFEDVLHQPAPDFSEPVHTAMTWNGAGEGFERLQRWESQLERRFFRLLHELESMQARRRGQGPSPPASAPGPCQD